MRDQNGYRKLRISQFSVISHFSQFSVISRFKFISFFEMRLLFKLGWQRKKSYWSIYKKVVQGIFSLFSNHYCPLTIPTWSLKLIEKRCMNRVNFNDYFANVAKVLESKIPIIRELVHGQEYFESSF